MAFRVHKAYWVAHRDLIVLAGSIEGVAPRTGGSIDLPRAIQGPGWVPIASVQTIPFADREQLCVVLDYQVLEGAPLMEFSALEGLALDCRQ